jgi:hypothetical protein
LPNEARLALVPSGPGYAAIEAELQEAGAERLLAAVAEVRLGRETNSNM